jgi:uncharacterized membrane protein YtjA (UPF0391 family)
MRVGLKSAEINVKTFKGILPSMKGMNMLYYAVVFFVVAVVAALLGFTGIAAGAAGIAKILFVVFLLLFIVSLIMGMKRRR